MCIRAFGPIVLAVSLIVGCEAHLAKSNPVENQVRKSVDEGARLDAHEWITDPQSPELVYLQYRPEAQIGAAADAEAALATACYGRFEAAFSSAGCSEDGHLWGTRFTLATS